MHEISPAHFGQVAPLLGDLAYRQEIHAIAAGLAPGRIWVDRPGSPRMALIWGPANGFLCGRPAGFHSARELEALFREELYPAGQSSGRVEWVLTYTRDWAFPLRPLASYLAAVSDVRRCYVHRGPGPQQPPLPDGFRLLPVDPGFLRHRWQHQDDLREWLGDVWTSPAAYEQHSLGYAIVKGDELVSACLAEYPTNGACDVGIFTNGPYRRRGFATLTAAACIAACLQRGWVPHWHCWESNQGSIGVAEKVGLRLLIKYRVYMAWYHPIDNWVVNGNMRLWGGCPAEAVQWYRLATARAAEHSTELATSRLLGPGNTARAVYANIARAHLASGDIEGALEALRQSALRGGHPLDQWLRQEEIERLSQHPQWQALQANQGAQAG